jgi:hypothetical protein
MQMNTLPNQLSDGVCTSDRERVRRYLPNVAIALRKAATYCDEQQDATERGAPMASGFKINKRGIRQMTREIEREFAKNPVRVPLQVDPSGVQLPPATTVNNYNGPVVTVTGDHAQISWNNHDVTQSQEVAEQVSPGYEELADLVTRLLASLHELTLGPDDETEARATSETILREVVKAEPDKGIVKRGVTMLKGLLAPVASGVTKAVTQESADVAQKMIESLGEALPL